MVKKIEKIDACDTKKCCGCKFGSWIFPLAVIVLVWMWPAVMWSKITVTVLMALALLMQCCPCKKK